MSQRPSHGKEPIINLTSSPVSKRTQQASVAFDGGRFKTLLDFQYFNNLFKNAPSMVERMVRFDTLRSTFIPRIFADKDQGNLFGIFDEPIEELIKEFYSNAWFTGIELKCWVWGKDFIVTPDYLAKILQINRLGSVDLSPYDDRLGPLDPILETLGANLEISSIGTSIGTRRFSPGVKTLALIIYLIMYPLSNMGFINLSRARFLSDLIYSAQIDICTHIFQILGRMGSKSTARTSLPFYNLIMKILLLKGICPPKNGTVLPRQGPISMQSLKSSKIHSSTEKAKKSAYKYPKSELKTLSLASPIAKCSAAPSSSQQFEAEAPSSRSSEPQPSQNHPPYQSSIPQLDRMMYIVEGLHDCISRVSTIMYAHNNQVQLRLTSLETQLDQIQRKLE